MSNRSLDDFLDAGGSGSDEETGASDEAGEETGASDEAGEETGASDAADEEAPLGADSADGDGTAAVEQAVDDADGANGVDPALSTYAWSGTGAECAVCGESTPARWRDEDRFVCRDCKEW